ncbi:hypothetical protein V6N12_004401 [Hibiscus sabdariffa]|uniref:Uncharacterized protein n=1 Tax=Hibiscus sabdariffa TaxID=183260 RepID=A0ABR2CLE6_9ROSI
MANHKTPELARCIEDDEPRQQDEDQLALNKDGIINTAIKNHSEDSLPDRGRECTEDDEKLANNKQELLQLEPKENEEGHYSKPKAINEEDSMILESQKIGNPSAINISM